MKWGSEAIVGKGEGSLQSGTRKGKNKDCLLVRNRQLQLGQAMDRMARHLDLGKLFSKLDYIIHLEN